MRTLRDHDVPALVKVLKQSNPRARQQALRALGRFGPAAAAALPCLRDRLDDLDAAVRAESARTLGQLGPVAVPVLGEALAHADIAVRRQAVWALKQLASASHPTVPALVRALRDPDLKVRKGAALTLLVLDADPALVLPALVAALGDTNLVCCRLAASVLARLGPHAVPALVRALTSADRHVRREAAWALGQIGPRARSAVPALLDALRSRGHRPLGHADEAREQSPDHGATPLVLVEPWKRSDRTFLLHIVEALGRIGPDAAAALPILAEVLHDADEKVNAIAADALARIQGLKRLTPTRPPGDVLGTPMAM
jgi:HEAT repeat protein